jgi:hypothetical protein
MKMKDAAIRAQLLMIASLYDRLADLSDNISNTKGPTGGTDAV